MINYSYKGSTIEIALPSECGHDGYSVECTYKYDKRKEKYLLSMWLKHKDYKNKLRIEYQEIDTQYISGNRDNIIDNICRIVEEGSLVGFFDYFIQRYEYEMSCFDRGIQLYEEEQLDKGTNDEK